jgi:tetraacyldisaccharide 4'-kinase
LLDILYSTISRARRRYYQRRPHLRRRLGAPVISVGNLTVGGSGKTPLTAEIARMLVDMNERVSILSRGYARRIVEDGVVIVSDGAGVLTDVARSGDEPLMLAGMVPKAAVLVSSSRYTAGRVAERKLGCTVHVLDDGFQHFDLMRDVDLLVAPDTLDDTRTLPFGRFREPVDAAAMADALLVELPSDHTAAPERAEALCHAAAERLKVATVFGFSRRIAGPAPDQPAYAFAGIARPERFYHDLEHAGWRLTGRRSFGDHHHYSKREIEDVVRAAMESGAKVVLTTEKDMVRLGSERMGSDPRTQADPPVSGVRPRVTPVPLVVTIDPAFRPWLADRLRAARGAGGAG